MHFPGSAGVSNACRGAGNARFPGRWLHAARLPLLQPEAQGWLFVGPRPHVTLTRLTCVLQRNVGRTRLMQFSRVDSWRPHWRSKRTLNPEHSCCDGEDAMCRGSSAAQSLAWQGGRGRRRVRGRAPSRPEPREVRVPEAYRGRGRWRRPLPLAARQGCAPPRPRPPTPPYLSPLPPAPAPHPCSIPRPRPPLCTPYPPPPAPAPHPRPRLLSRPAPCIPARLPQFWQVLRHVH